MEKCAGIFTQIGIDCTTAFTGISFKIEKPWELSERLSGDYKHNIILGSGNNLYQASVGFGFKTDADMQVINTDSFDELCDAWGELANTYCGMLMDKNVFTDSFNILTQSFPQYTSGMVYFPKAWAYSGSLVTEAGIEIFLGYAIRKVTF
jgi:hypothetical protein